ncbi:MAG TPA: hypothetical protein PKZ16_01045 [bacterium]|nr:hypothetical protein [bacterium]HPL95469.1 hypothetical protein [bacterium]
MHPRQKELFKNIIDEYIRTAEPVGSKLIVDKYKIDVSSATVRNDMMELEEAGYIFQPHISAGRVPTEYGYKKYVTEQIDLKSELSGKEKEQLIKDIQNFKDIKDSAQKIKNLAKILAEKSELGVFIGFGPGDSYYTGLANLFSQPEFNNVDLVCNFSAVIDHLDEVMKRVYEEVREETVIKIGRDNNFSSDCSAVMIKIKNVLLGIIGPMRMNYQKNVELINFVKNILK